jgi:hypothetical protein
MLFLLFALDPALVLAALTSPPHQPWFPEAPPLPAPAGEVTRVSTVEGLFQAAAQVKPGGTIMLADGHYMLPRYFELRTDDVTLRGESGDRNEVVLDGAQSRHGELVGITACAGVTVADLTIQNIKWNGFKINSDSGVQRVTIYNCVIHNIWQRGIKGVAVPEARREQLRPRDCRVQYCLFYNDRPKRFSDDPADTPDTFNGDYIGGMDIMYATNWTISDNVFISIQGRTRQARGAIFLWHDSRDCVVERNITIDCDSGICLGNSHRPAGTTVHCSRCVVRNNFVTRAPENGILADYTRDCAIVHNTVHDPENRLERLIRLVHDNDGLLVAHNLLSGPPMRQDQVSGQMRIFGNVTRNATDVLVDALAGDLHLADAVPGVVDAATGLPEVRQDIDGEPRDDAPDVGADELVR